MPSSVGLETMNSTRPLSNWKTGTKKRRSTRNFKGVAKVGNSASPKRVGDFSGSDSDKVREVAPGPTTSFRSKSVPIKKMRHILQSPSPRCSTLSRQVSASPQTCSSPFFEDQKQLPYSSGHSAGQRFSKRKLRRIDETAKVGLGDEFHGCYQTIHEHHDVVDFSGIQLLADTASMFFDDNASKKELVQDSLMPKVSDPTGSATLPKVCLKVNEQENYSSGMIANGGSTDCSPVLSNSAAASKSLFVNSEDMTGPNVDRQHWDLNAPMDAWEEPHDESIDYNTTNDVNIEENKLTAESPDIACSIRPSFEKHLGEAPSSHYFKATEKNASERNTTEALNCDAPMDLKVPIGECSSNVKEYEKTFASDRTQDITAQDTSTSEISESPFHVQCTDNRDSPTTRELPGVFIEDGQVELIAADTGIQDDEKYLSGSTITDSRGQLGVSAKHEDNRRLAIGSTTNVTLNSSKSFSDGAHSDGKLGSVSQNIHSNMVDVNNLSEKVYDSPYEDGELRVSFMYSWEDMEVEDECVDYESDGRNGDGSDAADYPGTGIAGGGLKWSIAERGSGPRVEEESVKLVKDDFTKKRQLSSRRGRFDVRPRQGDEYKRKGEGQPTDGKDGSYIQHQQFRSRRQERDMRSWGRRRQFNSNNNYTSSSSSYQGLKNRIQSRPKRRWESHHNPRDPPRAFFDRPLMRSDGGFYSQERDLRDWGDDFLLPHYEREGSFYNPHVQSWRISRRSPDVRMPPFPKPHDYPHYNNFGDRRRLRGNKRRFDADERMFMRRRRFESNYGATIRSVGRHPRVGDVEEREFSNNTNDQAPYKRAFEKV